MEVMHGSHGLEELSRASGLSGEDVMEKATVGNCCESHQTPMVGSLVGPL
jgi:hypothetical protein